MYDLIQIGGNLLAIGGDLISRRYVCPPLPPYTLRLLYKDGTTPNPLSTGATLVHVSESPNIWDWTYNNTSWRNCFSNRGNLLEVLGGNANGVTDMSGLFQVSTDLRSVWSLDISGVTNISYLFYRCGNLREIDLRNTSNITDTKAMFSRCSRITYIPVFDTSNVTNFNGMMSDCGSLKSVPLFDTSSATNTANMVSSCKNVESGALDLYNQVSIQDPVPAHNNMFYQCGSNTVSGRAELAQIPYSWGGNKY